MSINYSNSKIPNLFILMQERKVSATQLSQVIGATKGNISDWKSGKSKPSNAVLASIANYFDVSVDYLLGKEQEKKPAASDEPSIKIKNVKFIGRDGKVKYKNLSPEMISMLEQLPDSDEDL